VKFADAAVVGEVFEAERCRLFRLAYRLLGSASDAEDAVQTALERWIAADGAVEAPAAWLTTVVTNVCLKQLAQARRNRQLYAGPWLPEPVLTSNDALGPLETAQQRESVSFALLVLLERLTGPERAVYVLREAFGYRYAEIGRILGRSEAGCRQLHRRAAVRLGEPARCSQPDQGQWRELTGRFLAAAVDGNVAALEQMLAADAGYTADGEGSGLPVPRKPVIGRSRVAALFARVVAKYAFDPRTGVALEPAVAEVNGQLAVLALARGSLQRVLIVEADGWQINRFWLVAAPAKLAFAAKQAACLPLAAGLPGPPPHAAMPRRPRDGP
jgi:RNA polymerase sigma factor (sigma-70 family)